jgi:hypothetical protein
MEGKVASFISSTVSSLSVVVMSYRTAVSCYRRVVNRSIPQFSRRIYVYLEEDAHRL